MWGIRVIVPTSLQSTLLTSLHENHPGITKMTRSYFWWNGMDKAIETQAKSCAAGQNSPSVAPLHPWAWPETPWKRIHIDFAGPFLGKMFLIIVDAHSKWPEVAATTSQVTIEALFALFTRYGLPEQVVSDNGAAVHFLGIFPLHEVTGN